MTFTFRIPVAIRYVQLIWIRVSRTNRMSSSMDGTTEVVVINKVKRKWKDPIKKGVGSPLIQKMGKKGEFIREGNRWRDRGESIRPVTYSFWFVSTYNIFSNIKVTTASDSMLFIFGRWYYFMKLLLYVPQYSQILLFQFLPKDWFTINLTFYSPIIRLFLSLSSRVVCVPRRTLLHTSLSRITHTLYQFHSLPTSPL